MGFGSILSAGASIVGGLLGRENNKDNIDAAAANSAEDRALQKEFAQQGIRWKVADAKEAGIHPLYALGANTNSYSPVGLGSFKDNSFGDSLARAGQDIGRAIDAGSTEQERINGKIGALQVERGELENDLLRSQIARLNQQPTVGVPSGVPNSFMPGQNPMVRPSPNEAIFEEPGNRGREVGAVSDYGYARTPGGLTIVPSNDVKQRIEDTFIPETQWSLRNTYVFSRPPYPKGAGTELPEGAFWKWNNWKQEYQPHYKNNFWKNLW